MSSLKNCLKQPRGCEELEPSDTHLSQDKTSQRMGHGVSAKKELAQAREAHRQALEATIALEEQIGEVEPVQH